MSKTWQAIFIFLIKMQALNSMSRFDECWIVWRQLGFAFLAYGSGCTHFYFGRL